MAELATHFGVSRSTVREGLKALDLLESHTGPTGGTFVKETDYLSAAGYLKDSLALLFGVNELTLEELYEAREAAEVEAAGLAAERRTEEDLGAVRRIIEEYSDKSSDSMVSDAPFHRVVAEASKNRGLSLFVISMCETVRMLTERHTVPEPKQSTLQRQQQGIYEAIARRHKTLAQERMREHLRFVYRIHRQMIHERNVKRNGADAS